MPKNYNTTTASLKATVADIRNLDAKKISINGEDVLDRISDSEFHSYDTRDPQLKNDELDVWNTEISLSDDGNGCIEVKPKEHDYNSISSYQYDTIKAATEVINNEVLGVNGHLMYWLTEGLTDGWDMYENFTNLGVFSSSLRNLYSGTRMFQETPLYAFNSDLSNLTRGYEMFCETSLESFSCDLSKLTNGESMFNRCTNLTSFSGNLSSLTDGTWMFHTCTSLTSFSNDLSSLTTGKGMFYNCTSLTSFISNLSSLDDGSNMFHNTKLDAPSVANIVYTLPTHESGGTIVIGIGCDDTDEDRLLFAQECDCDTWQELLDDFSAKNWTVTFQFKGRPTA